MPFKSKAQARKCFAMKGRGQAKGWNCHEWADATPSIKKLPYKKKQAAVVADLEKQASTLSQLLGVRVGALILGVE